MTLLLRLLPLIIGAVAVGGGLGLNYFLAVTDWKTAIIFSVALCACLYVGESQSRWSRLLVTVIIGAAAYLVGGVHKEERLKVAYEKEVREIHEAYKSRSDAEIERQRLVNEEALRAAERDKEALDAETKHLSSVIERLRAEAASDPDAKNACLNVDAVRRLNRLRGLRSGS